MELSPISFITDTGLNDYGTAGSDTAGQRCS
jgi:hypothetical protein